MTNILFVHNMLPGRFTFLVEPLLAAGHRLAGIAQYGAALPDMPLFRWKAARSSTPGIEELAVRAESDFIRGRAAAGQAVALRDAGFVPDLVIGHPGWGETAFIKEVFPKAKTIMLAEFYYTAEGGDVGFDPEFGELTLQQRFRVHAKNATMAMALAQADAIVCPTPYQASVLPATFRERARIVHEGIDTEKVVRRPVAPLKLGSGVVLDGARPLITVVNRRFEPLRGFHIIMRALPRILEAVPDAHVLLIGADNERGYGLEPPGGKTWKQHLLAELEGKLDPARLHFTGKVSYDLMLAAMSLSWAHIYYTYPFVLSWSLMEAMACECLIVASDTAPLRDVIVPGKNGILNGFFDLDALSQSVIGACRDPGKYAEMRKAARAAIVENYDQKRICLPAWLELIDSVAANRQ
jgi:glycosyltransferase involved in cell wall biosynthesis